MNEITGLLARKDNYIWLLRQARAAVVIDPCEAPVVIETLSRYALTLAAVLVTHSHADHCGGVDDLVRAYPAAVVYGPTLPIAASIQVLRGGETLRPDWEGGEFSAMAVPGHTDSDLAYYGNGCLFCGDTLFTGGCGRVFSGHFDALFDSLCRLASLPDETAVYCGHEYTEANLRFALAVEPDNRRLRARADEAAIARAKGLPTVPSTLALEKATNPFLRCREPTVVTSALTRMSAEARARFGRSSDSRLVFSTLREWKNAFR